MIVTKRTNDSETSGDDDSGDGGSSEVVWEGKKKLVSAVIMINRGDGENSIVTVRVMVKQSGGSDSWKW